jgi:starch phosphorylase
MQKNTKDGEWFEEFKKTESYQAFVKHPVAYFSAEYALDSALPTYAGGLGILAGDFIREVAKQEFPLIAVGLFYQKAQNILALKENGNIHKIKTVLDESGADLIVTVPIEHRVVKIRARLWEEGKAKVYLLDTDIDENDPMDRDISKSLYDENRDLRLKQEILLGIGGFRLLAKLGYHASVYHLNEGHSAFLSLELVRHEMEHQKVNFQKACEYAKKHIIFTNHTLVPAGQERFATEKVKSFTGLCAEEICLNPKDIVGLGTTEESPEIFSMTTLSFNLSTKANAVSKIHMRKSHELWPEHNIENVTNGIFIPRWDKVGVGSGINLYEKHLENKKTLLKFIKDKTGECWSEGDLVIAWARRLVEYKQPLLIFNNIEKICEIIKNSPVPIRIIFSGPTGNIENRFATEIKKLAETKLKGNLVFIENYSTEVSERLTAGADIWLNTPIEGTEACGTSGMKAGLNGALALSTNDGWINEVHGDDIGWVVTESKNNEEVLATLAQKVIPLYQDHLQNKESSDWTQKMMKARNLILEDFSTTRALREYIEKLYIPTLAQKHKHKIE